MSLPKVPLISEMVDVAGTKIEVRSLSRAEQLKLADYEGDIDGAEVKMIAMTTGFPEDEVRTWREETPGAVVGALIDEIVRISGMLDGATKSGAASLPPGPGGSV
jgi:hypothetical protein